MELTQAIVDDKIERVTGDFHYKSLFGSSLDPDLDDKLRVYIGRACEKGLAKPCGRRDGWYRKVKDIQPIVWWNGDEVERAHLVWPYGVEDESSFGFDDTIEVFPGDVILVAGDSNWGKTTFALNIMVNNLHLFEGTRLMVNEYKPQRFKSRMSRFNWVDYWNENRPKFEVLPVIENHEDYILPNHLNIIDWLHLKGDFWDIATIIQNIQMQLRQGIALVILQKTTGKKLGVGGDWGKFFPSVYLTIDQPGKLSVLKVKSSPVGKPNPENKTFAFDIVDRGSKFHHIREVKTCPSCKGRGFIFDNVCGKCEKRGYIDIT